MWKEAKSYQDVTGIIWNTAKEIKDHAEPRRRLSFFISLWEARAYIQVVFYMEKMEELQMTGF